MAEVMMALGKYRFSVSTAAYQTLERNTEYRRAKQDRMGRAPARQFGGIDDDTVSLAGVILPAGLEVELPDLAAPASAVTMVKLWD